MKITKAQLKQIIKEEIENIVFLAEGPPRVRMDPTMRRGSAGEGQTLEPEDKELISDLLPRLVEIRDGSKEHFSKLAQTRDVISRLLQFNFIDEGDIRGFKKAFGGLKDAHTGLTEAIKLLNFVLDNYPPQETSQ